MGHGLFLKGCKAVYLIRAITGGIPTGNPNGVGTVGEVGGGGVSFLLQHAVRTQRMISMRRKKETPAPNPYEKSADGCHILVYTYTKNLIYKC